MEIQFQVAVSGFRFPVSRARQRLAPVAGGELAEKYWKLETGNQKLVYCYSIEIFRSSLKSLSILPVPSTTLHSGSSAIDTGNPVSSRMRLSRFFSNAPPPVRTMPRSLMSAESSGGV